MLHQEENSKSATKKHGKEMTNNVRMLDLNLNLYKKYKEISDKNGNKIGYTNKIIFEKAMESYIEDNKGDTVDIIRGKLNG